MTLTNRMLVKEAEHKRIHTTYFYLCEFQKQSKHIYVVKGKDSGYLEGWVILRDSGYLEWVILRVRLGSDGKGAQRGLQMLVIFCFLIQVLVI